MKMKTMLGSVLGMITGMCLCCGSLQAQDDNGGGPGGGPGDFGGGGPGGGFNSTQFQQGMMDQIRQELNVTNDDEWAAIQPLVQKVMDARREVGNGGGMGMRGPGGPGGFGAQAGSEQQALQKAIDENAPVQQIKDALARYRAARKDKQTKLETAQASLKSVLNVKQEAQAVLLGLLP